MEAPDLQSGERGLQASRKRASHNLFFLCFTFSRATQVFRSARFLKVALWFSWVPQAPFLRLGLCPAVSPNASIVKFLSLLVN